MRPILIGLTVLTLGFTPALIGATLAAPPAHASEDAKGKADKDRDDRGKDDKGKGDKNKDDWGKYNHGHDDKGKDDRGRADRGHDDRDKDNRKDWERDHRAGKDETVAERVLTDFEQAILRDYFRTADPVDIDNTRKSLPPGLAKRDSLPPGLAMQLERNGRLPPGLEGRALPADLESRLPKRAGTKRVILDNDVLLIDEGTRIILDILRGAAGGQ